MGRLGRFIVEYVGNLNATRHVEEAPRPASKERRVNGHARALMDWLKGQMDMRGLSDEEKEELAEGMRRALRQGGMTADELAAVDAGAETEPEWAPDGKGSSRDAPG